jgi:DNA-binding MarR family transcriptional regulator
VSRQHIQQLVNTLMKAKLVQTEDNPAHRRSPIITLTRSGREAFRTMRRREAGLLEAIAASMSADDIASTSRTLQRMITQLEDGLELPSRRGGREGGDSHRG